MHRQVRRWEIMMFWRQKKKSDQGEELLERIKNEIEIQLGKKGVAVSGISLKINPNSIALSIYLRGSKRFA